MTKLQVIKSVSFAVAAFGMSSVLSACHCDHEDSPKEPFKVGHVLCTDGTVMSLCDYVKSAKEAVGIVYHVSDNPEDEILGHAVYIHQPGAVAFADSCGVAQGTSMSLSDWDGNANSYAIYSTDGVGSPMANLVFDLWTYGQSAYILSDAELRALFAVKSFVNDRIAAVGGEPITSNDENCWLWTSTEVEGQQPDKAWLYSMNYGAIQETPKDQKHNVRPIIAIRR